ncbi:hypothetical protein F5J12DRAFT_784772 [Pisolithus orientalis]|uniref:uncharacterized protein n=1 Tax=Pisolithus orientalis TaxID=936130 RepID=UPI0022255995|nr:uncharacterized protein F5J12DRAFT_784772 [Pisolithus orientalis]KAI5998924.1 hypothetical protein F5J12DRAFT_784772 [Pisolithus orientalis]
MNILKWFTIREQDGYQKIIKSCKWAKADGYKWLWIDTCCIDKRSSVELSEKCYMYLNNINEPAFPTKQDSKRFGSSNGWPEWFSRGWTLQELIAPRKVKFFNNKWVSIGTKENWASLLEAIT